MTSNGAGRKSRVSIRVPKVAGPMEAAAMVAAVEQFLADTTLAGQQIQPENPWQRAALVEGVSAKLVFGPSERREPWQ